MNVLQWAPLSRSSGNIATAAEEEGTVAETKRKKQTSIREATLKYTFPESEFDVVIVWVGIAGGLCSTTL